LEKRTSKPGPERSPLEIEKKPSTKKGLGGLVIYLGNEKAGGTANLEGVKRKVLY